VSGLCRATAGRSREVVRTAFATDIEWSRSSDARNGMRQHWRLMVLEELSSLLILYVPRHVVVEKHHFARTWNNQMTLGSSVGGTAKLRKKGLACIGKEVHRRCGGKW
jgi:hypothetical protein